jgi:glycosyltransferase involved in cell wall biosynthesis
MAVVYNFIIIQMERKNPKIKVLFTIPNFDTAGSGKALLNIAQRLNPDIFEPHIACFNKKGEFFKVVERSGIKVHIIKYTHPMGNRFKGLMHCFKVARFFKRNKFDIIHSFHYGSDYSEALAAKLSGVKWVYTKKNMSWGGASKNSWNLRTRLADAIIYQNKDMKQKFFGDKRNLFFIPRGCNLKDYYPENKNQKIINEFEIKDSEKIILCVANLDAPVKGIEVLIDAFSEISKEFRNSRLILVGYDKEPYADKLKHKVNSLQLDKRIVFTGKRMDIKSFLSIADVFVLPTLGKGEGSPVSLLEAMGAGVIVLGSRIPGIRDQLSNFDELMFTAGNSAHLSEKIKWVLNLNHDQKKKLSLRLRSNVKKFYTIEREVKDHEQVYLALMNNNRIV